MKTIFLTFLLIYITNSFGFGQTIPLCLEKNLQDLNKYGSFNNNSEFSIDCGFVGNEEAYRRIENLMKIAGLPMNFTVCKAANIQNAYATVDSNGSRFILYDDDFLRKLDSDSLRLESITVLAHEIGHHLSAHTLFINNDNFKYSYNKYCLKESPSFDETKCRTEHLKFLKLGREQELEADRFAGYIMYKFGAKLDQVTRMYYKITSNYDDNESTHPNLNKRLDAVKAGYELAESKAKSNIQKIDLQEIKGSKIDFVVKNLNRIERNRLIFKIKNAATMEAMNYVKDKSEYDFAFGENWVSYKYKDKIINYHGQKDNYQLIDKENEYFELLEYAMIMIDDKRIVFEPVTAIHLKNNILKLLIFTAPESPKVVYSAPFLEEQVSLEEIKAIFIEIFKNGIQKEIEKFN